MQILKFKKKKPFNILQKNLLTIFISLPTIKKKKREKILL